MGLIDDVKLINIRKYIAKVDDIYAHWKIIDKEIDSETLIEHSELSLMKLKMVFKAKNLDSVIEGMAKKFFDLEGDRFIWKSLMINSVYLHDLGKININFQNQK